MTLVKTCNDPEIKNPRFESAGQKLTLATLKNLKDLSQVEKFNHGLLADINWPKEEYFINFTTEPVNSELKYWNASVALQNIEIPGNHIIKARQVGRTIGIPTGKFFF